MKRLTIRDGNIYLDDEKMECLKNYKIVSSTKNKGIAELTLVMDVSIAQVEI
ncbi:hypothetical protein NE683_15075 [Bariatricus massiliensis]|uniref:Uncharacterized protein n=1 Tax=Bariatricus massiliensis TaxID=1745713 RepID=A0ABS8DHE0_9FIRM|nr:hypothetical protein [Bariatricus massiliensis]MCB7304825.1 hypothetical protein [Bariatricus massiliensis]MCB7375379.1 hypothetical protein [Bariatricus massiliensis]MCB7387839.1 hypothetical protein [Bariatricus massiliensis]MCB7412072.1 hypothetical protein [Bariatricus massiliensis]MCQ5254547.1 hypothetical protein [Bariatricus massiliensis]